MSEEIVGNDELQESVVYIGWENIKSNAVSDWFREKKYAIGCALTCAASEKALFRDEFFLATKRGFKRLYESGLSVARCKDDCPVAKIEKQSIANFFAQILLSNKC